MKQEKIAIVYDWIDKWGGVERLLLALHDLFPHTDFFTSYMDYEKASWAKELNVKSSFIQKLPSFIRRNRIISVPLYPYAFESFDFSSYDTVISVSSSFAKGIVTSGQTKHISYILTPSRFLWINPQVYLTNPVTQKAADSIKRWDFAAAQRPDKIISISETVQARVRKYYKRGSDLIYPPFDSDYWRRFNTGERKSSVIRSEKFFLLVSRLEPYKRVDLAIQAFNSLGEKLVIVGKGSLERKLQKMAKDTIAFRSDLSDKELAGLYSEARALIIPQEEDFGCTALEAIFFGLPVIAFKKGGATELILEGKTGIFFEHQSLGSLTMAVERFKKVSYNLMNSTKKNGKETLEKFDIENFRHSFLRAVESAESS